MTIDENAGSRRRWLAALLTVLCLAAPAVALQAPVVGAAAATAAGARQAGYDQSVGAADCDLLGREFVAHQGCSRTRCVPGAVIWRSTYGAEACALRHAPKGYGFVATVDVRMCNALHRRWIAEVNYCASEPDRSTQVLYDAPQCVPPASVYVTLQETEGFYDECLTLDQTVELVQRSSADQSSLPDEVALRSSVQCPDRAGHAFVDGACVTDPTFQPSGAGVLMIGDSITWRGSDELGRLRPTFTIDGEPARPPTELAPRLAHYRALHGDPTGLIIELGTVPAKTFGRHDLAKVVDSLPARTTVMLVAPIYELRTDPLVVTPQSRKVDGWMHDLAKSRPHTCLADWAAYVRGHEDILQDGVHPKHRDEGRWAHWISQQWGRC